MASSGFRIEASGFRLVSRAPTFKPQGGLIMGCSTRKGLTLQPRQTLRVRAERKRNALPGLDQYTHVLSGVVFLEILSPATNQYPTGMQLAL